MSATTAGGGERTGAPVRDARYLKTMLALLVSVSFFEGYDGSILSLLLPDVQATFHASEALLGVVRIPIEFGVVVAFGLTNLADRLGRRRLLLISVIGYTLFTALTAVSWNLWSFAAFQFAGRIFLGAEYSVALTMIAEEYSARDRGRALGKLTTFDALGAILVALLLGAGLNSTRLGWRAFFLVGLVPLLILGFARRRLEETVRYEQLQARRAAGLEPPRQSLLDVWRPGLRRDLLVIGLVHLLRAIPLAAVTSWWAYFAERERGYSSLRVAIAVLVAYGLGCIGYYACGRMMDTVGRRRTGLLFFSSAIVFTIIEFQTTNATVAFVVLGLAVASGLGSRPLLSAWVAERFPTQLRSLAGSYVRNLFEVGGLLIGPALVGVIGDHRNGAIGNIGDTLSILALMQIAALYLVWRHLPETRGLDLDHVDALDLATLGARPSRRNVAAVVAAIICALLIAGAGIARLGGHERPEGVAERWLVAISELGRPGLRIDAQRRADRMGGTAAASSLRPSPAPHDAVWFTTIEVGKAERGVVPFAVTRVVGDDGSDRVRGTISVEVANGRSRVVSVDLARPGDRTGRLVPSEGGAPAAQAPWLLWALAAIASLALGPLLSALINRMQHSPVRSGVAQA